jgi:hypothetical protein
LIFHNFDSEKYFKKCQKIIKTYYKNLKRVPEIFWNEMPIVIIPWSVNQITIIDSNISSTHDLRCSSLMSMADQALDLFSFNNQSIIDIGNFKIMF